MQVNDTKWSELNEGLLDAMKRNDFGSMEGIYGEMVYMVAKEGKSAYRLLKEQNKCQLINFKNEGVEKVEILTAGKGNSCDKCQELDRKVLTIDEALETMPIPHPECSKKVFKGGHNFCRCLYTAYVKPVSDEEYEKARARLKKEGIKLSISFRRRI